MSIRIPFFLRWLITLIFVVTVMELSLEPGVTQSGDSYFSWLVANTAPPVQKLMHVAVYGLLTILWFWTLENVSSWRARVILAFLLSLGVGIALEWAQTSVPGRFGTIIDVILNGIGAAIGLLVMQRIASIMNSRSPP